MIKYHDTLSMFVSMVSMFVFMGGASKAVFIREKDRRDVLRVVSENPDPNPCATCPWKWIFMLCRSDLRILHHSSRQHNHDDERQQMYAQVPGVLELSEVLHLW